MEKYEYFNAYLVKPIDTPDELANPIAKAEFSFSNPIIPDYNNEEWMVGVASASLRSELLPLTMWNNQFYIGITFGGTLYTANCPWVPDSDVTNNQNYVYNVQSICKSFNAGMVTVSGLINAVAGGTITNPPELFFDENTQLFKLECFRNDFLGALPISVNRNWYNLIFQSFDTYKNTSLTTFDSVSGLTNDYQNVVFVGTDYGNRASSAQVPTPNSSGSYLLMAQKWSTPSSVFGLQAIRVYTDNNTIRSEMVPASTTDWADTIQTQQLASERVLIDLIALPNTYSDLRGKVTYVADEIRYHSIAKGGSFSNLNLTLKWIDCCNVARDINIPAGTSITIKLAFKKIK